MPNTSSSKKSSNEQSTSSQKNTSGGSTSTTASRRSRKRKCKSQEFDSDWENELEGCNLQDAVDIENKLRSVAQKNSLSEEEMRKILQKLVKNEHILALVSLQTEDELAREREAGKAAPDSPAVLKLTRAKARELNKTPGITLPSLADPPQPETAALIKEDLHSDDDDEEYMFKEEDFMSDDDPNTTDDPNTDLDSNPCTPQNSTCPEDSPVKFTPDGCFKVPLEKPKEDLRIATRTRSKLCLEQTTIEDLQSEFVPPDVEQMDPLDMSVIDEDWMQFLNDFTKPMNSSIVADEDDPINDPEYVGADTLPVDAEELRDVNISKKELTELLAELFEGLFSEHPSMESVDLETPQKFLNSHAQEAKTPENSTTLRQSDGSGADASRRLDFNDTTLNTTADETLPPQSGTEAVFRPDVVSTSSVHKPAAENAGDETLSVQVANTSGTHLNLEDDPNLIAVPVAGQPNCFQLAKILSNEYIKVSAEEEAQPQDGAAAGQRKRIFDIPSWIYISIRKHYFAEYEEKFEKLRHLRLSPVKPKALVEKSEPRGFTHWQYQMLQQQLCMHVQTVTQTFLQTYCHTEYWKFAPKAKKFLLELQEKAAENATFNCWNLQAAVALVTDWEEQLSVDNEENQKLVEFFRREINLTNKNTRQVPRFSPRIMDVFLNNTVFMYPRLLPRIPFVSRKVQYHCFAPTESQLVAMGLEYHFQRIADGTVTLSRKASPLLYACEQMTNKLVFGKTKRRIFDYIRSQRKEPTYNPIQYYYEHKRAPPINNVLYSFENNVVLPPVQRYQELPLIFQDYVNKQNSQAVKPPRRGVKRKCPSSVETTKPEKLPKVSARARDSYVAFVREAIGDEITLPDNCIAAEPPDGSFTEQRAADPATPVPPVIVQSYQQKHNKSVTYSTVVLNLNYKLEVNSSPEKKQTFVEPEAAAVPIITYDIDHESGTVVQVNDRTEPSTGHELNTTTASLHGQRKITDFLTVVKKDTSDCKVAPAEVTTNQEAANLEPEVKIEVCSLSDTSKAEEPQPPLIVVKRTRKRARKVWKRYRSSKERSRYWRSKPATTARFTAQPSNRAQRCLKYLDSLLQQATEDRERYASAPLVQFYYRHFRAFEKVTELLSMFNRQAASGSSGTPNGFSTSPQNAAKRARSSGDSSGGEEAGGSSNSGATPKKVNRKEENYRQMLLPDAPEDINRRDSTFALQFYKRVADTFRSDNEIEKFHQFNQILCSFDPNSDQPHDLYYKVQKLFLPNHPMLADSFLIFFLPEEANAIGKFLEHFLLTNMEAFVQKLKKYFHKQPVQLRKIFACLEELSDKPDLTMEHMKSRLVPLLRGNTILLDYFTQMFPEEPPPKSSMPSAEHVNLKYEKRNNEGDSVETINDMPDSPNTDHTACSLKYINGRIYNGPKMTLPAKLSFMAESVHESLGDAEISQSPAAACAHGIYSEPAKTGFDDSDYDSTKVLVIDSSGDGDNSSSTHSVEACDEATLRSHAMRLNPAHYNAAYYTSLDAANHANAKRAGHHHSNNNNDEGKSSPRKANGTAPSSPNVSILSSPTAIYSVNDSSSSSTSAAGTAAGSSQARRKSSPQKRLKSPNAPTVSSVRQRLQNQPPMVVIHKGHIAAVEQAKKLKAFIETSDSECGGQQQQPIVARTKNMVVSSMKWAKRDDAPPAKAQVHEEAKSNCQVALTSDEEIKLSVPTETKTTTAPVAAIKEQQQAVETPAKDNESTWNREEDKIILIEMQKGSACADELCQRIAKKLHTRSLEAIKKRYQFLVDTVKKVQKTS